jgi:hypothetical protein
MSSICGADPSLMVTSYTLEPEILLPGDEAVLTVTITNTESTATESTTEVFGNSQTTTTEMITATIENIWMSSDGDGDYLVSARNTFADIGDIAPGASITVSFAISAHKNISEGLYFPSININVEDYQDVKYPFPVRIDNMSLSILQKDVPSKISIGGATDISFNVVNKRKNTVDSITISSDENSDLDFYPNGIFISELDPGQSEEVALSVNPSELGQKILSLNLSYYNGNNLHYETYDIPIEIIEVLDVAPIFTNIPLSIKKGKSARIGLEVYNAKTESITGVIITPITDAMIIPSQYFIGSMDPDDVFSASFDIYSDMLDNRNHTIKFKVSYKQGNEYYETPSITHSFKITSGEGTSYQSSTNDNTDPLNEFGGDFFNMCIIIIALIIIIIIVIILWRWKKGRNNK